MALGISITSRDRRSARKRLCRFRPRIEHAVVGERKHSSGDGLRLEPVLQSIRVAM